MLLCVILFWPTEFENSLNFVQNVFEAWEFKENCLKLLFLGKLGSKQMFLKASHLILMHVNHKFQYFEEFLHYFALFFPKKKNCFFPEFQSIESVFQPIKIAIKILVWFCVFRSMLDWYWINRSIFDLSNFFFNWSKIV